ncbi:MAG: hypothetical protein K0B84_11530, partial [Firmicutes bacterium]|nr:hypothetical protein [Bacillota bacterium]
GGAAFLVPLGIPAVVGAAFFAVVAKSFAMTTLDSAMRFTRIAFAESVDTFGMPAFLKDKTISLIPGIIIIAYLAVSGYGMVLWPLFGAANQILAGIALLAAAVFLKMLKRPTKHYMIPFVIMIITSMVAMVHQIFSNYIPNGLWSLVIIGGVVFLCGIGIIIIAFTTWNEIGTEPATELK